MGRGILRILGQRGFAFANGALRVGALQQIGARLYAGCGILGAQTSDQEDDSNQPAHHTPPRWGRRFRLPTPYSTKQLVPRSTMHARRHSYVETLDILDN